MSKPINDGGPAFPRPAVEYHCGPQEGMSLRDWFAGQALAGICASKPYDSWTCEVAASIAYSQADAMLAARSKEGREGAMRTPDVEKAMRDASRYEASWTEEALAAEVERLEGECRYKHECMRQFMEATTQEKQRAEAAEARYAASQDALTEVMGELRETREHLTKEADGSRKLVAECERLEAQNARLRERAASLASQLAECAGYIASVRTDRQLTRDGDVYALQTLDWAEGALEIAEKANGALEAYDEALADTKGTP